MKKIVYECDTCGKVIEFRNERVEILGSIQLPGNINAPLALHFHDDCLPPALHKAAQRVLGNE